MKTLACFSLLIFMFAGNRVFGQSLLLTPWQQSAVRFIEGRRGYKVCIERSELISQVISFQIELQRLNRRYTVFYLDSVEASNKHLTIAQPAHSKLKCAHQLVFFKPVLQNYFVCEVYLDNRRDFTQSEAYLFKIDGTHAVFIARNIIAYN